MEKTKYELGERGPISNRMAGKGLSTETLFEWRPRRNEELALYIPEEGRGFGESSQGTGYVPGMFRE